MKLVAGVVALLFSSISVFSQVSFSANDPGAVPAYNGYFQYGTNLGYYGGTWDDWTLSDIAAGNPALNVKGAGSKTFRILLPEYFLESWSYDIRLAEFNHYASLGVRDNTVFVGFPSSAHRDNNFYDGCVDRSLLFANMYEPIWDGGANGTPVNENNYYALYMYKLVQIYKPFTKFYEITNEPDYTWYNTGWLEPGIAGNWWDNNPPACELSNLKAPIFHYIRMLRISYEVVKTLDPTAYVAVGGIGWPSFLDALLRNTDEPGNGAVSAAYPLKGGAYFDVLSFHSYPQFELGVWDDIIGGFLYSRHSDAAVNKYIDKKNSFVTVLNNRGYDGVTYPKKHFICTEGNVPRKELDGYIGSDDAAKNYGMKVLIESQKHDISQYYTFILGDAAPIETATNAFDVMGLFQNLNGIGPLGNGGNYVQQYTNPGIGFKTTSDLLRLSRYDAARTGMMELPTNVQGAAFRDSLGGFTYVLWAKTSVDRSEVASASYSFPTAMNVTPNVNRREWNFTITNTTTSIPSVNIPLTGSPVFISDNFQIVPLRDRGPRPGNQEKEFAFSVYPNPASTNSSVKFTLTHPANVRIKVYDVNGVCVINRTTKQYGTGTHLIPLHGIERLASGIYTCRFETDEIQINRKLVIAR